MRRIATCLLSIGIAAVLVGVQPPTNARAAAGDWLTYHYDNARDGSDPTYNTFTSATHAWDSVALDGQLYGQPLVMGSTVYVVTENNTLYAITQGSGSIGWSLHLADPYVGSLPCGNIGPPVGVTGTPAIDPSTGYLYAVGMMADGHYYMWAVDLIVHGVRFTVSAEPPGFDAAYEGQRGGLVIANGNVYIPYGGRYGDCQPYHGVVNALRTLDGARVGTFQTPDFGSGIWAPSGPAVDASGYVYAATGNGSGTFPHSETVEKLSPTLAEVDYWTAPNWASLDSTDTDLGSIGPTLVSGGLIFQAGKSGEGNLIKTGSMGHVSAAAFSAPICAGEDVGGAAYRAPYIYVPCTGGLVALLLNASCGPSFTVAWRASASSSPIVAGGAVWFVTPAGTVYALGATSGSSILTYSTGFTGRNSFPTPAAGGNGIFAPVGDHVVAFTMVGAAAGPTPGPPVAPVDNQSHLYVLDGFGGVSPAGSSPALSSRDSCPGVDIARGLSLFPDGGGGLWVDGFGGLHPIGSAVDVTPGAYWPNWDIVRGIQLAPWSTPSVEQGWVLDAFGGLTPFGGAPAITSRSYWRGWDIARGFVILPDSTSSSVTGYVLDGYGGLAPIGSGLVSAPARWPGWDIARAIAVTPTATAASPAGYILDGYGGLTGFGTLGGTGTRPLWPGWDIARGVTTWTAGSGGWILDGFGGVSPFGAAPAEISHGYWAGWDIARSCAGAGSGSGGRRPH